MNPSGGPGDTPPPTPEKPRAAVPGRGSSFSNPGLPPADDDDHGAPALPDGRSLPRRLLSWCTGNLGLKVLALSLTLMMWQLVREKIEKVETIPSVTVRVVGLPTDIKTESETFLVTLTLKGSQAEVARARVNYEKDRPDITVKLTGLDPNATEGVARFSEREAFGFPFLGSEVVQPLQTPLEIQWYRVRSVNVSVVPVFLLPRERKDLFLPLALPPPNPATVTVTGPERVVSELREIATDAVEREIAEYLKGDPELNVTPVPWTARFDSWRQRGVLRGRNLVTIEPEKVTGILKLRQLAEEERALPLKRMFPAGVDLAAYDDWTVEVRGGGSADFDPTAGTLVVKLAGDSQAIEELRLNADRWSLVVEVPPPPPSGAEPPRDVKVNVNLLANRDASAGLRLIDSPSVFISLKPKPK